MAPSGSLSMTLRKKVLAAVKKWAKSTIEPPFSVPELITMAVVALKDWPHHIPSGFHIMDWIEENFPFYGADQKSSDAYLRIFRYELPAFIEEDNGSGLESLWNIRSREAQIFLQHSLGPSSPKHFRFLDLPADLRNVIYELVLSYPESGVLPVNDTTSRRIGNDFLMLDKHFRKSFEIDRWTVDKVYGNYDDEDRFNDEEYRTRLERIYGYLGDNYNQPCQSKLALLLTNKQIYGEAMPFFYRVNNFVFTNVNHLDNKLRTMPAERRQHIRSVAFSYVPADISLASSTFQLLATIPKLQKLYIDIDEDSWTRIQRFDHRDHDLLNLAGLHDLLMIRGLQQVEFSSRCSVIAAQLKTRMEDNDNGGREGSLDVESMNDDNDAGRNADCAVNEG